MPRPKKTTNKKTPTAKVDSRKKSPSVKLTTRINGLLVRRPHRSFKRTLRRDYVRPLRLPSYWALTAELLTILGKNKKLFLGLATIYGILTIALIGLGSQDIYSELSDNLKSTGTDVFQGIVGEIQKAGLLFTTLLNGTLSATPTDLQRFYAVLLGLFTWLSTVWLMRLIIAGKKPKLRDALYNSGAPVASTVVVSFLLVFQLIPIALAAIAYAAASNSGLLDGGVEAMVFWAGAALLSLLSLYWATSTFIALVVVTLPGMYPMQAMKIAGDLAIGRRIRILLRMLWVFGISIVVWAVVLIPLILLDGWLKSMWTGIQSFPTIPIVLLVLGSLTVVWVSSYTYLLYRKVVDDDAAPAL